MGQWRTQQFWSLEQHSSQSSLTYNVFAITGSALPLGRRCESERFMKAALALLVIYVGAFLVAIQGSSSVPAQAAQQSATIKTVAAPKPIDPVKEADIRALLELVDAHDHIQESVKSTAEQYRERLLITVQNNQ